MLELWLTILLTLNHPDHPKALSPTSARTQIEYLATQDYGPTGWACVDTLTHRESSWRPDAKAATSSARGLFQMLRMPPNLSPARQYERFRRYIDHRYDGSPCRALEHSYKHNWY